MKAPNYDDKLNLRLYSTDKTKFKSLRKKKGLNPRDFLVELMDFYENEHKELHQYEQITLTMQSRVENSKGIYSTPLRKTTFQGEPLHISIDYYWQYLDKNIATKLKDRFGLVMDPDEIGCYLFGERINVYWHEEKNCYLVQERMEVHIMQECIEIEDITSGRIRLQPLLVERCNFVNGYDELIDKFGTYASPECLNNLRPILAKDIGTNYLLMNELF